MVPEAVLAAALFKVAVEAEGFFSMDSRKNVSTTALRIPGEGGNRVQEDGRLGTQMSGAIGDVRKNHEVTGLRVGNRSMTNLGLTAGRQ